MKKRNKGMIFLAVLAAAILCQGPGERPCGTCRHCRKVFRGEFPGIHPDVTAVERTLNAAGKRRREITVDQIRALGVDALVLPNSTPLQPQEHWGVGLPATLLGSPVQVPRSTKLWP